jgi:WD40 repeat protein
MNNLKSLQGIRKSISLAVLALIVGLGITSPSYAEDSLYIGDGGDNTIKRFDATTANTFQGIFAKGGIKGPMGLIFDLAGNLIVSNQNADTSTHGELLLFDGGTGALLKRIVANSDPNAPAVPRGIVLSGGIIYVAEFTQQNSGSQNKPLLPGRLLMYRETDGQLLAAITPPTALIPQDQFHPRGVVFGSDGLLYISNVPSPPTGAVGSGLGGQVLRYNPQTGAFDIFIDDDGGKGQLNRPEGLVFGPDRRLYITSFRANSNDTDSIRIYNVAGAFVDNIVLEDPTSSTRTFAQALLFGPNGKLFVPITSTGEVRRYDVSTKSYTYTSFVPSVQAGGHLGSGWYLTFGGTDPATLQYTH